MPSPIEVRTVQIFRGETQKAGRKKRGGGKKGSPLKKMEEIPEWELLCSARGLAIKNPREECCPRWKIRSKKNSAQVISCVGLEG